MTTTVLAMKRNCVHEEQPHKQSLASLVLLCREYAISEHEAWQKFKKEFFDSMLERYGQLNCAYCSKTNLERNGDNVTTRGQNMLATVDHVVPVAKGGAKLDPDNCVVACGKCNRKKADTLIEC